ncbi:FAD-dependent oxidoreductase [Desulfohalovibrio reitneri]|uniref:FAD-dependent oxidoreductase n=1 Tax=Desulfohalovibrio reitneri TaxID=1307759 RepID=UPI0004A780B7|nr:FAD-dependent oxidoreductase [Desulfohalovibrio reitneri]
MAKRIVIIGGVALGPKAACRARRLDPEAEIVLVDKADIISYGGCGIPYYVSGDVSDSKELRSTVYHVERDPAFFKKFKGFEARINTECLAIDRKAKTVRLRDNASGREEDLSYDTLVLATGATPFVPPVPGTDLPGVRTIADLHDADAVLSQVRSGKVNRAVVVGAGAIGLEMAESLADLWGVETTVVEMAPQVLPQALGRDMAMLCQRELERNEVTVLTSETVTEVLGDENGVTGIKTKGAGDLPCDLVIFASGVRPNAALAREAGLATGPFGGILVDRRMRTSDPGIYAGGDCVEVPNQISGHTMHLPLGSLANRQGRVVGTNIVGGRAEFPGAVGTFIIKLFERAAGKAGLTIDQARQADFDPVHALVTMADRAHFYPTQTWMYLKLVADRATGRVLGVECFGENGDAVKARVDAVAALLPHKPGVEDISNLEVGYAPPYASAMDIVNACANALENVLAGRNTPMDAEEFLEKFHKGEIQALDVRPEGPPSRACSEAFGSCWTAIPQEDLAGRLDEVPEGEDKPLAIICNSGLRSYESQCYLTSEGRNAPHVQGGWLMLSCFEPGFLESGKKSG